MMKQKLTYEQPRTDVVNLGSPQVLLGGSNPGKNAIMYRDLMLFDFFLNGDESTRNGSWGNGDEL